LLYCYQLVAIGDEDQSLSFSGSKKNSLNCIYTLMNMKNKQELNSSKVPIVCIDPSLEKYRDNTPFPEKLALANKMLKGAKLPTKKPRS
jgi:hypothetical protein